MSVDSHLFLIKMRKKEKGKISAVLQWEKLPLVSMGTGVYFS